MGNLFNIDNAFFTGMGKITDCVFLSILWVVFSLPIITMGAATSAMYYVCSKNLRENRGYIWKNFIYAFKSNFKQSTCIWIIFLFVFGVLFFDFSIMSQLAEAYEKNIILLDIVVVFFGLFLTWLQYMLAYVTCFENSIKNALKNTFFMMRMNIGWSILVLIISLAGLFIINITLIAIFIFPATFMLLINLILERVFHKYMTEDK